MQHLQKIQSNHAFKLLKALGYKNVDIRSQATVRLLKSMGFKIASVKANTAQVSTFIGNDVNELLQKHAEEMGVSKSALVREVLHNYVNKKNKIL